MTKKEVYELKVVYDGDSEIFRVIKIREDHSLEDLAKTLLKSIKFDYDHMYLFNMDNNYYQGENTYERSLDSSKPSVKISLKDLALKKGMKFQLWYDFGDDWFFNITVLNIEKTTKFDKPRVMKSQGKLKQYQTFDDYEEDFNDENDLFALQGDPKDTVEINGKEILLSELLSQMNSSHEEIDDDYVFTVNGKKITLTEINKIM
ncbi:plasmid pRiA4b ORF-3-like protein [Methanobrevibacter cuticularis]|uniref:Plasmid pRiA4b ORF-3-like protein n=1 Tax=Methanobrevibacter cuticularis TaxID=47311 RepID=A0A166CXY4_9EURY|nr:hypothetical protein [Methanobrevibacter cuticularis]KZX17537.1 plasmid pRiA4b ORF-3-like protein [Methanobrevibacter cuticularis]